MDNDDDVWGAGSAAKPSPNTSNPAPSRQTRPHAGSATRVDLNEDEWGSSAPTSDAETGDDFEESEAGDELESADEGFQNPQRWILIGPSASGKTSFFGSFEQAVNVSSQDSLDLRLNARNKACQELLSSALNRLLDESQASSVGRPRDLAFTLEAGPNAKVMNVLMADAAGSAMFRGDNAHMRLESEQRTIDALAQRWPEADSLLLLVPAERDEEDGDIPISQEVGQGLGYLTQKMMVHRRTKRPEATSWIRRLFGMTPKTAPAVPRLPFKRVLIVITKADVVAQNLLDEFHQWRATQQGPDPYPWPCPLPPKLQRRSNPSAREVAEAMEPIGAARRILSEKVLNQLVKAVDANCTVAVALVSVKGFSRDGHPIAGKDGLAAPPPGQPKSRQWRDKVVREWSPWGVRAALYFLATGQFIQGEPISALTAEVIPERRRS
jgi:hypothetical protein